MIRALIRVLTPLAFFALGVFLVRLTFPASIVVTWETASEVDTAGFLVYRSDSPDGPFSLLDETVIPARGDPLVGASYRYDDREVARGRRYFYQLEEIQRDGVRNRFPDVVEGQAGVGWPVGLAVGVLMAVLAGVVTWRWSADRGQQAVDGDVESTFTLDVGGVSLTLVGPAGWVSPFARTWASWAGETAGWEVRLAPDATLPAPDGPFFAARPRFADGRCRLEAVGFAGEIAPQEERGLLRAHPAADPGDLAYFVRTAFALRAFDQGALLFHAAGVVRHGAAYAFFGHSGSGKTTAARLSAGNPVLNDDLLLLRPAGMGWEAWATPFGRRRGPEIRSAPLRALLRLAQAPDERLEPLSRGVALGELIANAPVVNADPARCSALMARCEQILQAVAVGRLQFRKSATFWEVIDAHFG